MKKRDSKEITPQNFIKLKNVPLSEEYELKKKIAKAAFGEIYLVFHKETSTQRCLKLYNKNLMKNTN